MIEAFTDRWQARFAVKLLDQAKRETFHQRPRLTWRLTIAWLLSLIVLASPFVVAALGVGLILSTFPRVFPLIVGFALIGFAYILLPPRSRNNLPTYRRSDLPNLFVLLDEISECLGTTTPDGVHLDSEFNAYMAQFRTPFSKRHEWIIGIGFPLWSASSSAERVAHLAHEIGHKVNNDPMRQGVFFQANSVLENWYETYITDAGDEFGGYLFQMVLAWLVRSYYRMLSWFTFFESQRAEYRADAYASRVSGKAANQTSLEMLTRIDLSERSIVDLYPYRNDQNGRIFDHMARAVSEASPEVVDRFLKEAAMEKRRVDSSHPPTVMRIEFVQSLPDEWDAHALDASQIDFSAIDAELQPIKDYLGQELMEELYQSEVNR